MRDEDFDISIKRSDKYQPEGIDMRRFDELKPRILKAIDDLYCTLPQIKKAAGIDRSEDITKIIELLEEKKIIVRLYNGIHTAFFRNEKGKIPTKFWLSGYGKVEVDFEKPVPAKIPVPVVLSKAIALLPNDNPVVHFSPEIWDEEFVEKMSAEGLTWSETAKKYGIAISVLKQNLQIEKYKNAWDRGRAKRKEPGLKINPDKETEIPISEAVIEPGIATQTRVIEPEALEIRSEKIQKPKPKKGVTIENLRRTAERQPTIELVAKFFQISVRELNMLMRRHPEFQEAYNTGRRNRKENLEQRNAEESAKSKEKEQIMQAAQAAVGSRVRKGIKYSEEMFEKFGKRGLTKRQIANELGIAEGSLNYQLKKTEFAEAYERGLNARAEKQKQKETKTENLSTQSWTEEIISEVFKAVNFHFRTVEEIADGTNLPAALVMSGLQELMNRGQVVSDVENGETIYLLPKDQPVEKSVAEQAEEFANDNVEFVDELIPEKTEEKSYEKTAQAILHELSYAIHTPGSEEQKREDKEAIIFSDGSLELEGLSGGLRPISVSVGNARLVSLGNAGKVTIHLDYNPFEATDKTREFVDTIVSVVRDYEGRN